MTVLQFPGTQQLVDVLGADLVEVLLERLQLLQADVQQACRWSCS